MNEGISEGEKITPELTGEIMTKKPEIAIVDDLRDFLSSLKRSTGLNKSHNFSFFSSGEELFDDLKERVKKSKSLPDQIMVDFDLKENNPETDYPTGLDVIDKLKELMEKARVKMPEIIGISSDSRNNTKLVEAGARKIIKKLQLSSYLRGLDRRK